MKANDREVRRKKRILDHAVENGNVAKTCRYFGIPRSSFYRCIYPRVTCIRNTVMTGSGVRSRLPNHILIKHRMRLSKKYFT